MGKILSSGETLPVLFKIKAMPAAHYKRMKIHKGVMPIAVH
jgi:hypothetical protein